MTKTLRFHGCSDDTFGEYAEFKDDYDNCASGKPIDWEVLSRGRGVVVTGQYARLNACWSVSVTPWGEKDEASDEVELPPWSISIQSAGPRESPHSPTLVIEAPDDVKIRCLQRSEDDGS